MGSQLRLQTVTYDLLLRCSAAQRILAFGAGSVYNLHMSEREFWIAVRRLLLSMAALIAKRFGLEKTS